jgi:hypothetical protein
MDSRSGLLATPLGQFGLGALALVVGAALLFTLIGAVSGDADDTDPQAGDTFAATDAPTDTGGGATDDPGATGAPTDGATDATTAPTEGTTDGATDAPTASETPTETTPAVDPASITIQVLGGADLAADEDAVIACLDGAGYSDLITGNRARTSYDATTVFYTGDAQAEAQQVADTLGVATVEQQPGNLSEDVPVHVVAGNDGSDLC